MRKSGVATAGAAVIGNVIASNASAGSTIEKGLLGLVFSIAMVGCTSLHAAPSAQATLAPTKGHTAHGTVTFTQDGDKVAVDADIAGLTPGAHGFHVHANGDCSAPDATSAGGHFDPGHHHHGDPSGHEHHEGDLPMLHADADGHARLHVEMPLLSLESGPDDIVGKAVIVHEHADDFSTQPTGNAGARVACGVIMAR